MIIKSLLVYICTLIWSCRYFIKDPTLEMLEENELKFWEFEIIYNYNRSIWASTTSSRTIIISKHVNQRIHLIQSCDIDQSPIPRNIPNINNLPANRNACQIRVVRKWKHILIQSQLTRRKYKSSTQFHIFPAIQTNSSDYISSSKGGKPGYRK